MKFDAVERAEILAIKNEFVEYKYKKRWLKQKPNYFALAMVPLALGLVVSMGFLISSIVKTSSLMTSIETLNSLLSFFR